MKTKTRVDVAHQVVREESAAAEVDKSVGNDGAVDKSVGEAASGETTAEQLRTQANQLASHLRTRQQDLDRREAQVNARVALLERDMRAARFWLAEREAELKHRSEQLDEQQSETQERWGRFQSTEEARTQFEARQQQSEAALRFESQKIAAEREALQQLNRQLLAAVERRRQAVESHAAKLLQCAQKAGPELLARQREARHADEAIQARQMQLEQAETRLVEEQATVRQLRQQLHEARRESHEQTHAERRKMAAEHRQAEAELQKQREAVSRRSEHVDHCRKALEQLRAELGKMHRETLEIRLATEELWVQLSGAAPPAALIRSLGQIRSKLADHYRQANTQLYEQRTEIERLRDEMSGQYEKLVQQKHRNDQWMLTQHEETQQQASRLVAREQQLKQRQEELDEQAHAWQAERIEYQHEIRCLRAELAGREEAVAAR
ncbi:MAG: hypothetical protein V3R99_01390 [Thermoguttaceae bacterium]